MLASLPYADLLAIHNALAEKPARRFDTRANGEKRTLALMEARDLTLEDAARLADGVVCDSDGGDREPPTEPEEALAGPPEATPSDTTSHETIAVDSETAPLVNAFVAALANRERPIYLTTFLRRLSGENTRPPAPRGRQMTASQKTIVALCERPQGATGKEMAAACGWPSIAARATCRKLAERFGYTLRETPRTKERGISFHMTAKPAGEA